VDEWRNRYIKLRVQGSNQDIAPFKIADLINDPKQLFAPLANAGWNGFTSTSSERAAQETRRSETGAADI
jgi:hypothetical protein